MAQEHEFTTEELKDCDTESLVRLCFLTKDLTLSQRREMRTDLVKACLSRYHPGAPFEAGAVRRDIHDLARCSLPEEDILTILDDLIIEGIVKHKSQLTYEIKESPRVPQFNERTDAIWKDFEAYVKSHHKDYDPYLHAEVRKFLDTVLLRIIARMASSRIGVQNADDVLPIEDFAAMASEMAHGMNLSPKYGGSLLNFLQDSPESLKSLVFECYSGFIKMDLLLREQEINSMDFSESIGYLILDTTFITALLCSTDPAYPVSWAVATRCKEHNIPMYFCPETRYEQNGLIIGSRKELTELSISGRHGVVMSQFVQDYLNQDEEGDQEYIARLEYWERALSVQFGITEIPDNLKTDPDQEAFEFVMMMLPLLNAFRNRDRIRRNPGYIPRFRSTQQLSHDAHCLGVVRKLRLPKENGDKTRIGPWFLTYDSLVSGLDDISRRSSDGDGLVIHPRTLLDYFIVFSRVTFDKEDRDSVAQAVIRYTARSLQPQTTLEGYSKLAAAKLGVGAEDIDIIKRILMVAPLRSELQKALRANDGRQAEKILYETISDRELVEQVTNSKKLRQKLQDVAKKLRAKEDEVRQKDALIAELQKSKAPSVTVNTYVSTAFSQHYDADIGHIIKVLKAEGLFEEAGLGEPDLASDENRKGWLRKARHVIEGASNASGAIKDALLIIDRLLGV